MPNWTEELPEDLQTNETLSRFETVEALAKGYLETKANGSQSLRVPPSEAGPEARTEFLNNLIKHAPELTLKPTHEEKDEFYLVQGKPEEITGYSNPEEYKTVGDEVETQIREMALKANLTDEQYQSVIQDMSDMNVKGNEHSAQSKLDADEGLKNEWGMTYEERVAKADKVNTEFFPEIDFATLGPNEIKGRYEMSTRLVGKGPQGASQPGDEPIRLTPAEALKRQQEIMNRPAYWDSSDPEHSDLKKKVVELGVEAGQTTNLDSMQANPFQ